MFILKRGETMNIELAKKILSFHSCRNDDINNPKWENGFLGSLRPFQGKIYEENFKEIIECLKTLEIEIKKENIDKNIVSDIISIIHLTRVWVSKKGILGENNLLTNEQTKYLLTWVDIIESCFMSLLEGASEEAFFDYDDYCDNKYF